MRRKKLGAIMLLIGLAWMVFILTVDENISGYFNDMLLFVITCLSGWAIIFGIALLLIKTQEERLKEMQVRQEEQEKLKAYHTCMPIVTYALIGMNVLGAYLMDIENGESAVIQYAISRQSFSLTHMVSSMFAHASVNHLLFNMIALYLCGHKLEAYLGRIRYGLVYVLSGLGAALLIGIFSDVPSVGASGAIFGMMGCFLLLAIKNKEILRYTLKYELLPTLIISLIQTVVVRYISVIAHVGGLIVGMVCYVVFCRNTVLRTDDGQAPEGDGNGFAETDTRS